MNTASTERADASVIRLVTDAAKLRQQLRFAFANHFSVVQELIQNARRAGATRVLVNYDPATQVLTVADDGVGIADFQTLLTFAASGWDDATAAAERPYGMGFLAAVYAAAHVEIVSRGQRLAFDTEGLLQDQTYRIESSEDALCGTRICLTGVVLADPHYRMPKIAKGYPIPIFYNGDELQRPEALSADRFKPCPVGHIRLPEVYSPGRVRVYLQGFLVHEPPCSAPAIVHLDGAMFRGKFPDRDRVIDEEAMLQAVHSALKALLAQRLADMKSTMTPVEFCRAGYPLAASLKRLDVFNDIDVLPREWFSTVSDPPSYRADGRRRSFDNQPSGEFTRTALAQSGRPLVMMPGELLTTPLDDLSTDYEDDHDHRIVALAHCAEQLCFMATLHRDHWIYRANALDQTSEIEIETVVVANGTVPSHRTHLIGGTKIQLCSHIALRHAQLSAPVLTPMAFLIEGEPTILVPVKVRPDGDIVPRYPDRSCLRQCCSYDDEDAGLEADEMELNHAIRGLIARSPHEQLELLLRAALASYTDELKGFASLTMTVDGDGRPTLCNAVPAVTT